jgi:precorrin-2/cobalt-factor-2 C20-methyltransferase
VRSSRPDVVVETVPGITAMQDLAARAGIPLCEGSESLALVPITGGLGTYRTALRAVDTVVAYKGGRHLPEMIAVLADAGRLATAVVGCGLGLPTERIIRADQLDPAQAAPYLTTVLAPPARPTRGGRL